MLAQNIKKIAYQTGIISTFLAVTISTVANADVNDTIEESFDFNSDGRIQLSNINGDVSINACDCSQVNLRADISASDQTLRDRISVKIQHNDSTLNVETKYKQHADNHRNHGHSKVTYTLSVPNDVQLNDIDLVNGNLYINRVSGSLNADLVNGKLISDGQTRSTSVDTVNGKIKIHFSDLSHAENINLETVNGDIEIYLPTNANAMLEAQTISGRLSNDFGIEVIKHKYVGSEMKGTIGSGDVKIKLENVNGKIAVKSD